MLADEPTASLPNADLLLRCKTLSDINLRGTTGYVNSCKDIVDTMQKRDSPSRRVLVRDEVKGGYNVEANNLRYFISQGDLVLSEMV